MGSSQSKQRTEKTKGNKQAKHGGNSNWPSRDENAEIQPIKSKKKHRHDQRRRNQPISTEKIGIQPIRYNHVIEEPTGTTYTEREERKAKQTKEEPSKSGSAPREMHTHRRNEGSNMTDGKKSKTRRTSHRKRKEQIKKDKKMQRVTKEQLRSLASTLKRTSWYLGLRLGMDNSQARRYGVSFATEEERKYQILLWWRRVKGWKATSQQLVILLELGQYTEEEYSVILTLSNGDVSIYEKAPEFMQESVQLSDHRELYHSDATKRPARSYGNMSYDDTMEAQNYKKENRKIDSHSKKQIGHRETHQKRKLRHKAKDPPYNTLPTSRQNSSEELDHPRWSKPKKSLDKYALTDTEASSNQRRHRKSKATIKKPSPESEIPEEAIYAEISKVYPQEMKVSKRSDDRQTVPDGSHSITSHTDDSGIVTSPPLSPRQTQTSQPAARNDRNHTKRVEKKTDVGMIREKRQSSKTLIVRRCSDSVVKLRYESLSHDNPKPKEPIIKEEESWERLEQLPSRCEIYYEETKDDRDVINNAVDITTRISVTESVDAVTDNDDISNLECIAESTDDGVTDYEDVKGSNGDVTNSNCDLTKVGYRKDIQSMIQKYDTLTTINDRYKRESMAESIARHYERTTLPRDFTHGQQSAHHASYSSLNSDGSHRSAKESRRHRRHSRQVRRYHYFTFGGKGRFPSRFKGLISGLAIFPNGKIVASDGDNKRIQIFDKRGKFATTFDTNTDLKPKGACITPDDKIAVCCGDSVNVYDSDGSLLLSFGQGIFRNNSYSVCCDANSNYYVTDIVSHTISIHDNKGNIRKRFGFEGSSMIHFNQPVSVAISRKNHLYITDSQNHCIKVYTLSGRPLFRIGAKGSADGLFWNPLGICLDGNDQLYVADCGNNRISQFDSDGNFVQHLLTEEDGLWMPSLVQMNKHGQLVVCEWEKQLIKVFTVETVL